MLFSDAIVPAGSLSMGKFLVEMRCDPRLIEPRANSPFLLAAER